MSNDISKRLTEEDFIPFVEPNFHSVGWRLLAYFFFVSFLPLFIVGYFMIQNSQFFLKNEVNAKLESVAQLKVQELRSWINLNHANFRSFLIGIKSMNEGIDLMIKEQNFAERDTLRSTLSDLLAVNDQFSEFFMLDPDSGKILVSTSRHFEGQTKENSPYFQKGKRDLFMGRLRYSDSLGANTLVFSKPFISDDGSLLAVFAARINLNSLGNLLSDYVGLGEGTEVSAVTRFYKPVADLQMSDGEAMPVQESIYTEGVERGIKGEKGIAIYNNYDGVEVIGYFEFLRDYDFVFLIEQPTDKAFEPIAKIKFIFVWILLIVIVADVMMAHLISNNISLPLQKLTESAKRISEGDYDALAEAASYDEYGILARAFNKMSADLTHSSDEINNIFQTMPSALFILDEKGVVKSVNRAALELTEYDENELVGQPFKEVIRSSEDASLGAGYLDLEKLKKEEVLTDVTLSFFTKYQRSIPISLSSNILKDRKNKFVGFIVIVKDLRELKKYAKERVQKITPFLHSISLGDFSQTIDVPTQEDEFTELLVSIDLMADNLRELIQEDKRKAAKIKKSQDDLLVSHEQLKKEKENVDEEKAKIDALIENLGEGLMAIDDSGKIILLNRKAEQLFGKNLSDVRREHYAKVFHFEDEKGRPIKSDIFSVSGVVLTGRKIIYFMRRKADPIPLSITVSPISLEGKSGGNVVTFRDITKEMEIDKAKSEFVSLASHQLRTPLTGIKWLLQEVLRKGGLEETQEEYMHDIYESSERMINLVNDLLNVSRLETQAIKAVSEKTNLAEFLDSFMKEATILAKQKAQNISLDMPDQNIEITLDKQLIGQVITNLLSNAINYTDEGKKIGLSVQKKAKTVDISFTDEGIGIAKEDQKKLFTKFFRTKEASRRSTTGSGLGLYIVQKILEECDGTIKCESEEGQGTTFTVTLPLKGPVSKGSQKTLILKKLFKPLKK